MGVPCARERASYVSSSVLTQCWKIPLRAYIHSHIPSTRRPSMEGSIRRDVKRQQRQRHSPRARIRDLGHESCTVLRRHASRRWILVVRSSGRFRRVGFSGAEVSRGRERRARDAGERRERSDACIRACLASLFSYASAGAPRARVPPESTRSLAMAAFPQAFVTHARSCRFSLPPATPNNARRSRLRRRGRDAHDASSGDELTGDDDDSEDDTLHHRCGDTRRYAAGLDAGRARLPLRCITDAYSRRRLRQRLLARPDVVARRTTHSTLTRRRTATNLSTRRTRTRGYLGARLRRCRNV